MTYFTVLWYKDNPIIQEYQEKYFLVLKNILSSFNIPDIFNSIDLWEQKTFLLHPDISSLIQNISNPDSQKKLLEEIVYFCNGENNKLTLSQWEYIWSTNIKLTLEDNNPQNMEVWHPDHDQEGMLGWWEKSEQEWGEVFWRAFSILEKTNKDFFDELNHIIKKIVPMKTSIDVHNSCSYKECVGTLYLGYTTNAENPEYGILEALIHESSHNKLNLIMQSEKLMVNDYALEYYSPYRPDARHLHGVLLWVHAIVPTVFVLLQAIEKWYIKDTTIYSKVLLYHIKNKFWYRVLKKYWKFTQIGSQILLDIWNVILQSEKLIQSLTQLQEIDISSIQKQAKAHILEVQSSHQILKY